MSNVADILRRIQQKLEEIGQSETAVSKAAGKPDAIRNIRRAVEAGHNPKVATETLEALAKHLNTTATWLLVGDGLLGGAEVKNPIKADVEPVYISETGKPVAGDPALGIAPMLLRDLPVYAAAEGGEGALVVSVDPIDMVPRPWYLGEVREGYGVLVTGESMSPEFEPGDMAIVNPKLPHMRGKVHIFATERDDGHFLATIKRLVRATATEWIVEQHNPPKTFSLQRSVWTTARRVVGKYSG